MRNSTVVLALILFTAGTSQSDEGLQVRYQNPTSRMSLTMSHEIRVRTPEPIASREFSFDLVLTSDPKTESVTVTIDRADLLLTMMGKKTLMAQIDDGTAKISGDKGVLEKLAATLVVFDMGFEIMPGTKDQAQEEDLNSYEVGPIELHGE